jgi:glycosyltransferase involved in cell wall biosynthesis
MLTKERIEKIDHIVVLSEWQQARFARLYPVSKDRLTLIRNGIHLVDVDSGEDRYAAARAKTFRQRKPRVIFSSSADRGLDVLLGFWPAIREKVPEAELHVFYGFNVLDAVARQNPQLAGEEGGILLRGRVGQSELADEMGEARVWGYPTAFLETSCIGAMEARAAGLPIVTSELAALVETVAEHGILIPSGENEEGDANKSTEYGEAFISAVARLLTDEKFWVKWHEKASQGNSENEWDRRIPAWAALVPKKIILPPATEFLTNTTAADVTYMTGKAR